MQAVSSMELSFFRSSENGQLEPGLAETDVCCPPPVPYTHAYTAYKIQASLLSLRHSLLAQTTPGTVL